MPEGNPGSVAEDFDFETGMLDGAEQAERAASGSRFTRRSPAARLLRRLAMGWCRRERRP